MKRIAILLTVILALAACDTRYPVRMPISSIRNESTIQGKFFLGCGQIGGVEYIFAWMQTVNGWALAKVPRTSAYILMDTPKEPYVKFTENKFGEYSDFTGTPNGRSFVYFHVPPGTIISEYVLR